jgi:hypothetical protein
MSYRAQWVLHGMRRTRKAATQEMQRLCTSVGVNALITKAFNPDGVTVWLVWYDKRED